jgi:hypothetical protein
MTLSLTEIDAVVAELAVALSGAVLAGVDVLPGPSVVLRFGAGGKILRLLLCARPHYSRLHLTTHVGDRSAAERVPVQSRDFSDRSWRELRQGRITGIKRLFGDRVVGIEFAVGERRRSLLFECSGQHPNLFLCDDRSVIQAMLAPNKSQRRDLKYGSRYARPLRHEHDKVETLRFVGQGGSVSAHVEAFYDTEEAREGRALAFVAVRAALHTSLANEEKKAQAITADLSKTRQQAAAVAGGEIVLNGEMPVRDGAVEWQEKRVIAASAAADRVRGLLTSLREGQSDSLEMARRYLDSQSEGRPAERPADRPAAGSRERGAVAARPPAPAPAPARQSTPVKNAFGPPPGVRRFRADDGTPIWVSPSPDMAARLTFEVAEADDLWMRVDGGAGAHVIVACGNREPPLATLVDAALLAIHFSRADAQTEQPVQVARRRDLRQPGRDAPLDAVQVGRSRLFTIRPDSERSRRVLATEGARPTIRKPSGPRPFGPKRRDA